MCLREKKKENVYVERKHEIKILFNILLRKTTDVFYTQQGAFGNDKKELY